MLAADLVRRAERRDELKYQGIDEEETGLAVCHSCKGECDSERPCTACGNSGYAPRLSIEATLEKAWWQPVFLAVKPVWEAMRHDGGLAAGYASAMLDAELDVRELHPWYLVCAKLLEQERSRLESEDRYKAAKSRQREQA